ncbi:hypothetical protein EVAR_41761_1 [Eumeta japonica]|uniref:Uncharacterized protein n=1 Tax=Eumeta variegata TaxID=151549 RepID=A0A4C1W1H1_EUMVA|nr:hypothetical protein EVAR_41761_1 [Eumeta japonica]
MYKRHRFNGLSGGCSVVKSVGFGHESTGFDSEHSHNPAHVIEILCLFKVGAVLESAMRDREGRGRERYGVRGWGGTKEETPAVTIRCREVRGGRIARRLGFLSTSTWFGQWSCWHSTMSNTLALNVGFFSTRDCTRSDDFVMCYLATADITLESWVVYSV